MPVKMGFERELVPWIEANVELRQGSSTEFWYDQMESQSGQSLPVLYQAFDSNVRSHFVDRGQILDFAISAGGGRVLDFGPGDGWPSLLMAPMLDEVVGVEGSRRRAEVCRRNAARLGVGNATFVYVPVRKPLPFDDNSFDAITAASSIEQTPDPHATLEEMHRILRPGGRLRIHYESLEFYHGRAEREVELREAGGPTTRLTLYDREIAQERVRHFGLVLDLTLAGTMEILTVSSSGLSYAKLTPSVLDALCEHLVDAVTWISRHPSCGTLLDWLGELEFSSAKPTYDGGWFAGRLFDCLPETRRPVTEEGVDGLLMPLVEVVTTMEAPARSRPGEWDPWITAVV